MGLGPVTGKRGQNGLEVFKARSIHAKIIHFQAAVFQHLLPLECYFAPSFLQVAFL